jgi:hypothetical protein
MDLSIQTLKKKMFRIGLEEKESRIKSDKWLDDSYLLLQE